MQSAQSAVGRLHTTLGKSESTAGDSRKNMNQVSCFGPVAVRAAWRCQEDALGSGNNTLLHNDYPTVQ